MASMTASATTAKIALLEIGIASAVFPAAIPISAIVYVNQCDPETIMKTGMEALDLYDRLGALSDELTAAVDGLSADQWSGTDRARFTEHVADFRREILGLQVLAMMTGVALITVGMILLLLVVTYAVISTVLAALAVFFLACAASVVGEPVAVSIEATANSFAASANPILQAMDKLATLTAHGAAIEIGAGMVVDTGFQLAAGNTDVLGDLVQATVDGLDNALWGFASRVERDFVAGGVHPWGKYAAPQKNPGWIAYGTAINTDPYRDSDGDTQYGQGGLVDRFKQLVPDYNN